MAPGSLSLTIASAMLSRDTELILRMSPYVIWYCGAQTNRTPVCSQGGKMPMWNSTFQLQLGMEDNIRFEVYDRDEFSRDDRIGEGFYNLMTCPPGSSFFDVPLTHKGMGAGSLKIQCNFMPGGGAGYGGGYGAPAYGAGGYGAPAGGYGAPVGGYGAPAGGYGAPAYGAPGYGAPGAYPPAPAYGGGGYGAPGGYPPAPGAYPPAPGYGGGYGAPGGYPPAPPGW